MVLRGTLEFEMLLLNINKLHMLYNKGKENKELELTELVAGIPF